MDSLLNTSNHNLNTSSLVFIKDFSTYMDTSRAYAGLEFPFINLIESNDYYKYLPCIYFITLISFTNVSIRSDRGSFFILESNMLTGISNNFMYLSFTYDGSFTSNGIISFENYHESPAFLVDSALKIQVSNMNCTLSAKLYCLPLSK